MKTEKFQKVSAGLCNLSVLLYTLWLMLPAVQTTGRAAGGCMTVALFALGVLLDVPTLRRRWKILFLQAFCALTAPLFLYFFLERGGNGFPGFYVQNVMLWFPMIFVSYAREKNDPRLLRYWKAALLAAVALTALTTVGWLIQGMLRGGRVYAYSRSLGYGGEGREAYLKELMLRNIGGYDFIYGMVISMPFTCAGIGAARGWKRVGFSALLCVQTAAVVLSQYTYAMLFAALLLAMEALAALIRFFWKKSAGVSLLWATLPFALVFFFRVPLTSWAAALCERLGLSNFSYSLRQLLAVLEGGTLGEENRLSHYALAWRGFLASPLTGSLFGGEKLLSQHSEALDLLSATGVLGTALFCAALWIMSLGALKGLRKSPYRAQIVLSGCAFLAVATAGTVFYSRDPFLLFWAGVGLTLFPARENAPSESP